MEKYYANVQSKIKCIYEVTVTHNKQSNKRHEQSFNIEASNRLIPTVLDYISTQSCFVTEKVDGTCTLIQFYEDKPWLWLRHDRKPVKFKNKKINGDLDASLNAETHFKEAPVNWCASKSCLSPNNELIHDPINRCLMGWVPLDPKSRQHCWHSSGLNEDLTRALILTYDSKILTISYHSLQKLLDTTLELVGTNINANPYNLGNKKYPLHFLIIHGSIPIDELAQINIDNFNSVKSFFDSSEGQVEGIVWHIKGGPIFKLHRHHMNLKWPIENPRLCTIPVLVQVDHVQNISSQSKALGKLSGQYTNLHDLSAKFIKYMEIT